MPATARTLVAHSIFDELGIKNESETAEELRVTVPTLQGYRKRGLIGHLVIARQIFYTAEHRRAFVLAGGTAATSER